MEIALNEAPNWPINATENALRWVARSKIVAATCRPDRVGWLPSRAAAWVSTKPSNPNRTI